MITLESVCMIVSGLGRADLEHFLAQDWVRPARRGGEPVFREIDIARIRLILDLRSEMEINDSAMPVVLSLLDQLYDTRRQLRLLCGAVGAEGVEAALQRLAAERNAPRNEKNS
jgi:chaperone modulatory protein CbpM